MSSEDNPQNETTKSGEYEARLSKMRSPHEENDRYGTKSMLRFSVVKGYPNIARTILRIRNASNRKLNFKFKCEIGYNVSAHPNASGIIASHSTYNCVITWHRPPEATRWDCLRPPRLAIVTNFLTDSDFNNGENNTTKFIANMANVEHGVSEKPPKMILSFGSDQSPIVSSCETPSEDRSSEVHTEEASMHRDMVIYNAFIEWMQLHPTTLLVAAIVIFMVIVCALSAERDDYY